jgi:hypothetical protein
VCCEEQISGDEYYSELVESCGDHPVFPAAAEYKKNYIALLQTETAEIMAGLIREL